MPCEGWERDRCDHRHDESADSSAASVSRPPLGHGEKVPNRDDPYVLISPRHQQISLVAGQQEIRRTSVRHGQYKIVVRVGANRNGGKLLNHDRYVAQLIDKPAGTVRINAGADFRVAGDAPQFVELLGRGESIKTPFTPERDDMCWQGFLAEQGADE